MGLLICGKGQSQMYDDCHPVYGLSFPTKNCQAYSLTGGTLVWEVVSSREWKNLMQWTEYLLKFVCLIHKLKS